MKQLIYLLIFALTCISCNNKTNNQRVDNSVIPTTDTITENAIGYSIYKFGDILIEVEKNAKFEFVAKGQMPKLKTKGDTLYLDDQIVLLGDNQEIDSSNIFKKFTFKSKFDSFKVDKVYKGKLAPPNFKTDPHAKLFITRIKEGCKEEGVSFAGHYTIVEWGCGQMCQQMAIVDRISGQIIYSKIPFDTVDGHSGTDYNIDSRMLMINTATLYKFDDYEPGYIRLDTWREPSVYEIKNGRLKRIE